MKMLPAAPAFSLRRRLVLGLALAVSVFWFVAMAGAGLIIRHEINEVFDSALQEVVQRILPLAYSDILAREAEDTVEQRLPDAGQHDEYITYVVRDAAGRVLLRSHDAQPSRFPATLPMGFASRNSERFYTESAVSGTILVSAMERSGHRTSTLRKAVLAMTWPLLLLLPGIMAATYWLVVRSVRPVAALGVAITSRGEGNLMPVDPAGLPAEVMPVGGAVNALLERLRRALAAERSFTANAAHELRTPVAGALAQTQRLIAELGDAPSRKRAGEIEMALRRLARLTEKLLQLAKAEGGALRNHEAQDLRPVLRFVLADIPDAGRVEIALPDHPVLSTVDIDVFAIALRNLVENALKYSPLVSLVRVRLDETGELRIANRGAVLAQEDFARLCQRFERGASLAEGAGLGLAIVTAIARGAGGTLAMASPVPGEEDGVEFRLSLPPG
jgi:two-component system, OmpR family, sensor kinase